MRFQILETLVKTILSGILPEDQKTQEKELLVLISKLSTLKLD